MKTDSEPMFEDIRRARIAKDKGVCTECGKYYEDPMNTARQMTIRRVKPFEPDSLANTRTICRRHLPKEER